MGVLHDRTKKRRLIVAICSFVCYQIRINVEEAVLQKYFKEYNLYKEKTYKLFPYIY